MAEQPAVALLGTGIMGAGMGRSMLRAGLAVRAWNRTAKRAEPLAADGAVLATKPADAVRDAGVIVTMLSDVTAVTTAIRAAAPGLRAGQVWAQASTVGLAGVADLAALADELGLVFVDAPVLGTRAPAEQGSLTVFAAGPEAAQAALGPVFGAIGARTVWLGPEPGTATRIKLVVNSWVLAITNAAGEAISLARGLNVDPQLFLDTVSGGPLDCPYLRTKAGAMLTGDYTPNFTASMAAKDAALIVAAAETAGLQLDVAGAVAQRLSRTAQLGHGDEDMAANYHASFMGPI